jgi:hypothetical protein
MPKMIHIVHGDDGKIIAASESRNPPRPLHMQGLTVGEFELPAKFKDKKMNEYVPLLVVDVAARHLREKAAEQKGKQ